MFMYLLSLVVATSATLGQKPKPSLISSELPLKTASHEHKMELIENAVHSRKSIFYFFFIKKKIKNKK